MSYKRRGSSGSNASGSRLSELKRKVADQRGTIDRWQSDNESLERTLSDLKRSVETLNNNVKLVRR